MYVYIINEKNAQISMNLWQLKLQISYCNQHLNDAGPFLIIVVLAAKINCPSWLPTESFQTRYSLLTYFSYLYISSTIA